MDLNRASEVHIPGVGKVPGSPVKDDGVHWYPPGPVSRAYMRDKSMVCGIKGPFRSGKSVTSIMKLIKNAQTQRVCIDGWRHRRTAIIRNTYPELRTTTMPTFFQWIPKHRGKWRESGPPMLHIIDPVSKMNWEILFIALDTPEDLKKLLSMELSDAYVNEAREVPKAIIDALTGRIGQYPATWQGGCDNAQLIMDTNPPDSDHWWYVLAEKDGTTEKNRAMLHSILEAEEALRSKGHLAKDQPLFSFHAQPSGRSVDAENIRNLRGGYYETLMAGKDQDFIKVYVDGEYGFVMDGKPVYPEYKDSFHARDFGVVPGIGLRLGFDFGLTPAATISQRLGNGRWLFHDELVSERLGVKTFADELARYLLERYPGVKIVSARGDPAGEAGKDVDPNVPLKILQANGFPIYESAPTNDPVRRKESMRYLLKAVVDGDPAISLHRTKTPVMRKGMSGGYNFKRVQVTGEERFRDAPDKNKYSHIVEAGEYDLISAGEDRHATMGKNFEDRMKTRPTMAMSDYDIFNSGG